mmetsp:Transcript_11648/g.33002  ORF Transcript_11648/g.33002 Transcript_11648/m.33002 type:complete len:119 (+) Transcript_11648:463-819(+)
MTVRVAYHFRLADPHSIADSHDSFADGQKAGMNAETIRHAAGKYKMSTSEARKILEVESTATLGEIRQKYEHLFEVNEKHGTFYLQSKIYRAMERLEAEAKDTGEAAHDSKQSTEGEK